MTGAKLNDEENVFTKVLNEENVFKEVFTYYLFLKSGRFLSDPTCFLWYMLLGYASALLKILYSLHQNRYC